MGLPRPAPKKPRRPRSPHFIDFLWIFVAPVGATMLGGLLGFLGANIQPSFVWGIAAYVMMIFVLNIIGGYVWSSYDHRAPRSLYLIVSVISAATFFAAAGLQRGGTLLAATAGLGIFVGVLAKKGQDEF